MMKICVIRGAGGHGDAVTIQPAVAGLRERYPSAEIDWVLPPDIAQMFTLDPAPSRILSPGNVGRPPLEPKPNTDLSRFGLKNSDYDLVYDMWCPAHRHELSSNWDARLSRIENFCLEADVTPRAPRLYVTESGRRAARKIIDGLPRPVIVVGWHTARMEKDWPLENWRDVARRLSARGASVVFVGQRVCGPCGKNIITASGLAAQALVALCAFADLVAGSDSAICHIAAAVGTPTLWLFGPTNPVSTLRFYPKAHYVWRPEYCDCMPPCYYNRQRGWKCPARYGDCMLAIPPGAVALTAERIIDWERAEEQNAEAMAGDGVYRHFCRLGHDSQAFGSEHGAYAEFIDQAFGPLRGKKLLDVGAACGADVLAFSRRGADAYGCEPDKWMAEHALPGLGARITNAAAEDGKLPAGTFEIVHSRHVLEYVPEANVAAHLAAIRDSMAPGGIFYAAVTLAGGDLFVGPVDKLRATMKPREWWAAQAADAGFVDATEEFASRVAGQPLKPEPAGSWFVWRKSGVAQ